MIRLRFFLFGLLLFPLGIHAQVSLSSNVLNFFTVFTGESDTLSVTIDNNTPIPFVAESVDFYHSDVFRPSASNFTVPAGGSFVLDVICEATQNVRTGDQMVIRSSSHPVQLNAFTFAFVRHLDPYYDLTFDLWHEDLKSALNTIVTFGYTDLGYNPARDRVFMDIDNEAVNGQGASQNTLTCRYTGSVAAGYSTRPDAQTTFNLNTEHTLTSHQCCQ